MGSFSFARRALNRGRASALRVFPAILGRPSAASEPVDLSADAVSRDPHPTYEKLRQSGPVHYLPAHGFWIVLSAEGLKFAFTRPDLFSNQPYEKVDPVLLGADPPRHTDVRRLVGRFFTPEAIGRVVARAEAAAARLIVTEFDAVKAFAAPVSRASAAELMGLDEADAEEYFEALSAADDPNDHQTKVQNMDRIVPRSRAYRSLMEENNGVLDEAEVLSLARFLWLASTFTTERVVSWAIFEMLRHPDARAQVQADPSLLKPYVEEIMRLHPPENLISRRTCADVEIGGVVIPKSQVVQLCLSAANRDPARFDRPHELRLDRKPNGHISFGSGPHVCSGAALSRRLLPAVLGVLLRKAPDFRAAGPLEETPLLHSARALAPARLVICSS
jgi:cytochrome P450